MNKILPFALLTLGGFGVLAIPLYPRADDAPAAASAEIAAGGLVDVTATVEAVDMATRMVTLRGVEGDVLSFRASDEVRNLAQVEVGDQVTISYFEAVMINLHRARGGTQGAVESISGARADLGQKPGGTLAREVTMFGIVESVDLGKPSVTLRAANGKAVELAVRERQRLQGVEVGDQVQVTYMQSLVVSVQPAKVY